MAVVSGGQSKGSCLILSSIRRPQQLPCIVHTPQLINKIWLLGPDTLITLIRSCTINTGCCKLTTKTSCFMFHYLSRDNAQLTLTSYKTQRHVMYQVLVNCYFLPIAPRQVGKRSLCACAQQTEHVCIPHSFPDHTVKITRTAGHSGILRMQWTHMGSSVPSKITRQGWPVAVKNNMMWKSRIMTVHID